MLLFRQYKVGGTVVLLVDKRVDGCINIDLDVEEIENGGGRATYSEIMNYTEVPTRKGRSNYGCI